MEFKEKIQEILNERNKKLNRTNIDKKIIDAEALNKIMEALGEDEECLNK